MIVIVAYVILLFYLAYFTINSLSYLIRPTFLFSLFTLFFLRSFLMSHIFTVSMVCVRMTDKTIFISRLSKQTSSDTKRTPKYILFFLSRIAITFECFFFPSQDYRTEKLVDIECWQLSFAQSFVRVMDGTDKHLSLCRLLMMLSAQERESGGNKVDIFRHSCQRQSFSSNWGWSLLHLYRNVFYSWKFWPAWKRSIWSVNSKFRLLSPTKSPSTQPHYICEMTLTNSKWKDNLGALRPHDILEQVKTVQYDTRFSIQYRVFFTKMDFASLGVQEDC